MKMYIWDKNYDQATTPWAFPKDLLSLLQILRSISLKDGLACLLKSKALAIPPISPILFTCFKLNFLK